MFLLVPKNSPSGEFKRGQSELGWLHVDNLPFDTNLEESGQQNVNTYTTAAFTATFNCWKFNNEKKEGKGTTSVIPFA